MESVVISSVTIQSTSLERYVDSESEEVLTAKDEFEVSFCNEPGHANSEISVDDIGESNHRVS